MRLPGRSSSAPWRRRVRGPGAVIPPACRRRQATSWCWCPRPLAMPLGSTPSRRTAPRSEAPVSRLASQAVGGYFPTPPRVLTAVGDQMVAITSRDKRHVVRVLDPCAGTGEPVAALAQTLGGESFGIEINDE